MRIINNLNMSLTTNQRNNYPVSNLVIRLVQDNIKGLKLISDYKAGDKYYDREISKTDLKMANAMYNNIQQASHINHLIPQINIAVNLDSYLNQTGLDGVVPIALYSGNCLWIYVSSKRSKQLSTNVAIHALAKAFVDVTPDFNPESVIINIYAMGFEEITDIPFREMKDFLRGYKRKLLAIAKENYTQMDDEIDVNSAPESQKTKPKTKPKTKTKK